MIEIETGEPLDRYRQEDVDHYCEDIAMLHKMYENDEKGLYELQRKLCRSDLYYLGYFILKIDVMHHEDIIDESTGEIRKRVYRPFVFNRCWDVQNDPDFHVDIWARGHFKSVIITELKSVQDLLINPNVTIGIYSYNATIARSLVSAIRTFLENTDLQRLFPEILPSHDEINAKKYTRILQNGKMQRRKLTWTDESFSVKRTTTKKEDSVMGYGLVTGQAVSKHFDIIVFDDVVTPDSVKTESANETTTEQWKQAINTGEGETTRIRVIGTRYSFYDTYYHILNPKASEGEMGGGRFTLRQHPCLVEHNGDLVPVMRTKEYLAELKDTMHGFVWDSQMMCNPSQSSPVRFYLDWISERCESDDIYKRRDEFNWYIMVDPANTKNKKSDNTAMVVIGAGSDNCYYVPDLIGDRLTQSERKRELFKLVNKWTTTSGKKPLVIEEQSGLLSDMEYFRNEMARDHFYFDLIAATTKPRISADKRMTGIPMKDQRIQALEPLLRSHRVVLAKNVYRTNSSGNNEDMMESFINNEYNMYPFCKHDDILDALCRIADAETGPLINFPSKSSGNPRMLVVKTSSVVSLSERSDAHIPY